MEDDLDLTQLELIIHLTKKANRRHRFVEKTNKKKKDDYYDNDRKFYESEDNWN